MKSFIISLIILFSVTSAVFINAYYSDKICKELLEKLSALPVTADGLHREMIEENHKNFEEKSKYLSFVLPKAEIDELFCDYADIRAYYYSGDTPSYTAVKGRAVCNVQSVQKGEKPVWWSCFAG